MTRMDIWSGYEAESALEKTILMWLATISIWSSLAGSAPVRS